MMNDIVMPAEIMQLFADADAAKQAAEDGRVAALADDGKLAAMRTAEAVESLSKGFSSYATVAGSLYGAIRAVQAREDRLDGQLGKLESIEESYGSAFDRALSRYNDRLNPVADKAKEELDGAVEEACGKVKGAALKVMATLGACAAGLATVMILCAVIGGFWALVGAAWLVRMSPELQEFANTPAGLAVGIGVPVVIFAVGIFAQSPPTRGAWIEITPSGKTKRKRKVAPHTGGVD